MQCNFDNLMFFTDEEQHSMGAAQTFKTISQVELDALMQRVEHAIEHDLSVEASDLSLLLQAIQTLAYLQTSIEEKNTTLAKLRKLLGMMPSSEKRPNNKDGDKQTDDNKSSKNKSKAHKKPRAKSQKRVPQTVVHHQLTDVKKGDQCPACYLGTLHRFEPAEFIRISGHSPLQTTKHVLERLRCNACGQLVTAELDEQVTNDGPGHQMYGYSARAMISIHKYFAGTPFCRYQSLQQMLQTPVTASTQYDQCALLAHALEPVMDKLKEQAANGQQIFIDDSHFKILNAKPVLKPDRGKKDVQNLRTGVYASCFLSNTDPGPIVLYDVSIGHAGEFADDILCHRLPALKPPNVMSDALSSNKVTAITVQKNLCNVHARRQFIDIENSFPYQADWIVKQYQIIFNQFEKTEQSNKSARVRLRYHQRYSKPVFERIKAWCEQQLIEHGEQHSTLAKALQYFLKHYQGLTAICMFENAHLENNSAERALKLIIRSRKNSLFCKTEEGAKTTNIITSIVATCAANQMNAFEYMIWLQRNRVQVKQNPQDFLPWTFAQVSNETELCAEVG